MLISGTYLLHFHSSLCRIGLGGLEKEADWGEYSLRELIVPFRSVLSFQGSVRWKRVISGNPEFILKLWNSTLFVKTSSFTSYLMVAVHFNYFCNFLSDSLYRIVWFFACWFSIELQMWTNAFASWSNQDNPFILRLSSAYVSIVIQAEGGKFMRRKCKFMINLRIPCSEKYARCTFLTCSECVKHIH